MLKSMESFKADEHSNDIMIDDFVIINGDETKRNEDQHKIDEQNKTIVSPVTEVSQLENQLKKTKVELDETKTRLSKVMGDRLTDNNPNIANLSDSNRPTKLAERFQELYDNQWTDAFEVVSKCLRRKKDGDLETKTITVLIEILMEINTFCVEKARKQSEAVRVAIIAGNNSSHREVQFGVNKHVKECRKTVAAFYEQQLYQMLQDTGYSNTTTNTMAKCVPDFVKECFSICWLMTLQDPSLVFGPKSHRGDPFNTDLYKAYTKTGPKIDFVVWPTLLLHENGPVLAKGIAQGLSENGQLVHKIHHMT